MDRLFFDTNVLLDVLEAREPFLPDSLAVLALARSGRVRGATSALSLAVIAYLKRKEPVDDVVRAFTALRQFLAVAPLGEKEADLALAAGLPDLEDALQWGSARGWKATHLVTRNTSDFRSVPELAVLSPGQYLARRKRAAQR